MKFFSDLFKRKKANNSVEELPEIFTKSTDDFEKIPDNFILKRNKEVEKLVVIERLKSALKTEIRLTFDDIEQGIKELEIVIIDNEIIHEIKDYGLKILENDKFRQVFSALKTAAGKYEILSADANNLLSQEKKLTDDITKYAQLVKELGAKFKLSADWEGKKPQMIALGQKLSEMREKYLADEAKFKEILKLTIKEFAECHRLFEELAGEIIVEFEKS